MSKLGRNEPCHCGSGKKYKHCCLGSSLNSFDDALKEILDMDDNKIVSFQDFKTSLKKKQEENTYAPVEDCLRLSSEQMTNWLANSDDFKKLEGVMIHSPKNIQESPVMRYLEIMIQTAIANDGIIKLTERGFLPTKIVHACTAIYDDLNLNSPNQYILLSNFKGRKEADMEALTYTRILAEMTNIFKLQKNTLKLSAKYSTLYQKKGIHAFFLPLLKTASSDFNWGYFDGLHTTCDINFIWIFMTWRLAEHANLNLLVDEVCLTFPDLLDNLIDRKFQEECFDGISDRDMWKLIICFRFIDRFFYYFGFVKSQNVELNVDDIYSNDEQLLEMTPLFKEVFEFTC